MSMDITGQNSDLFDQNVCAQTTALEISFKCGSGDMMSPHHTGRQVQYL